MKTSDFIRNAYGTGDKSAPKKESEPVVKPALFKKLTKEDLQPKQQVQITEERRTPHAKPSASQQLENATDYLKSGGLIKVPAQEKLPDGKDSVYRRVAKFLVLIGEDEAAKILPHLSESQIEKINRLGYSNLPIGLSKTQFSFSNPPHFSKLLKKYTLCTKSKQKMALKAGMKVAFI